MNSAQAQYMNFHSFDTHRHGVPYHDRHCWAFVELEAGWCVLLELQLHTLLLALAAGSPAQVLDSIL